MYLQQILLDIGVEAQSGSGMRSRVGHTLCLLMASSRRLFQLLVIDLLSNLYLSMTMAQSVAIYGRLNVNAAYDQTA